MVAIQFLALFLIIIAIVWVIVYVATLSRNPKFEIDKFFISRYFIILVIMFLAGGIIRTIQQYTDVEWLDGFVAIFGGLFLSLMGVPLIWWNRQNKYKGLKRLLFFLLGLFVMLLGLGIIYLGITQTWEALI
jgi:hypothetical protein